MAWHSAAVEFGGFISRYNNGLDGLLQGCSTSGHKVVLLPLPMMSRPLRSAPCCRPPTCNLNRPDVSRSEGRIDG